MRKTTAALATLSLAVLALTGCTATASFNGEVCDRAATSSDNDNVATVTGDVGSAPDVEMFTPVKTDKSTYSDLVVGTGPALISETQSAVFEFALFSGETGESIGTTAFDSDAPILATLGDWSTQFPSFTTALKCATGGSRVLATISPNDFGAEALTAFGLKDDDSVVAVLDVVQVFPSRAAGALQFNDAQGMPTVVRAPDGRPGIIVPDSDAPTSLEVQTLIKGDGATVADDSAVLLKYTGVLWNEKTVFDTSWDGAPVTFDLSQNIIDGFKKGLAGQTVGSQVLIVVPPDSGYGDAGQGTIPGDATLVFVVDILGIDPPAAAAQQ